MFTDLCLTISQKLFAKPTLSSKHVSLVQEGHFWNYLPELKKMGLCQPLIILTTSKGIFLCLKLLRPLLEFHVLIQSSNPHVFCQKLQRSFGTVFLKFNTQTLYQRPLFQKMQTLSPDIALHWPAKMNPLEGSAIQWALAGVYETAWRIKVPQKATVIRTLTCEIQRILWGLEYFKRISQQLHWISWQNLWLDYRESFLQIQETVWGSRIFPNVIIIGGVNKDINIGNQKRIQKYILEISPILSFHIYQFIQKASHQLKDFFPIDRDDLEMSTWGGAVARASQSWWDARLFASYGLEKYVPTFAPSDKPPMGDALDRLRSVADEIFYSLKYLPTLLSDLSELKDLPLTSPILKDRVTDPNGTVFVVEGSSGPIYAAIMDWQIAISTSSMRGYFHISSLLSNVESQDTDLALSSLGYQECEGSLVV